MRKRVRLSAAEARRVALAAQGFGRPRPQRPSDARHFRRALSAIGVLQLDFVNVLIPAHFLILWSRLGAYERSRMESYLYDSGDHIEQWAHEASIVASSDWPLLAHRRREYQQHKNSPLHALSNRPAYLRNALEQVQADGALTSNDLPRVDGPRRRPGDWHRSIPRWALEYHFGKGNLVVRRRLKNFQRVYDLPENVLANEHLETVVPKADAQRELLRKSSAALGIATLHDLADYYRMSPRECAPRIDELIADGTLSKIVVDGWAEAAYLNVHAKIPRGIPGASLLSPFDPLVWYRPRAERLFGFEYRIEIYVPADKRRWGYYVLPFRHGDRISARVDLKSDRQNSVLLVLRSHLERGAQQQTTAVSLGSELRALADWLELDSVRVARNSEFAKALAPHTS